jgi:hypothetical protein
VAHLVRLAASASHLEAGHIVKENLLTSSKTKAGLEPERRQGRSSAARGVTMYARRWAAALGSE